MTPDAIQTLRERITQIRANLAVLRSLTQRVRRPDPDLIEVMTELQQLQEESHRQAEYIQMLVLFQSDLLTSTN